MRAAGANFASANCVPVGCPGRRRQLMQLADRLLGRRVLEDVALFAGRDVQHALALRARWRVSPLLASHDAEDGLTSPARVFGMKAVCLCLTRSWAFEQRP